MNTNIISVIIPSYKPQNYVYECLGSLKNQTLSSEKFEILLILNGCCEPYKSQIEDYVLRNNITNLMLIQIDQAGVSNARNVGLDKACGEYICFIDDDDYISTNYLEELLKVSSVDTIGLSNVVAFNDETRAMISYAKSYDYEKYSTRGKLPFQELRRFFSGPCMKMMHSSIIDERRFDLHFKNGEDSLFMFLISDRIRYVNFAVESAIYYRRIRMNSLMTSRQSLSYIIGNRVLLVINYSKIYFSNPSNYSLKFYITRLLGSAKAIFQSIIKGL